MLAGFGAVAPAAMAEDAFGVAACAVNGAAGITDDDVDSINKDLVTVAGPLGEDTGTGAGGDPTKLTDTDNGGFSFESDAVVCGGADIGGASKGAVAPGANYSIEARGEYTNLVCGSGHAVGTADLDGGPGNATSLDTSFSIVFAGGVGKLTITGISGVVDKDGDGTADETISSGEGDGAVHIAPDAVGGNGNCVNEDIHEFTVDAVFDATLSS